MLIPSGFCLSLGCPRVIHQFRLFALLIKAVIGKIEKQPESTLQMIRYRETERQRDNEKEIETRGRETKVEREREREEQPEAKPDSERDPGNDSQRERQLEAT